MIEVVCEFVVKEDTRGLFELAYGPGGVWSKLFGRCEGFRGTTLLRDTENPLRFLSIELWDTLAQREQALVEREVAYASLETDLAEWAESKTEMGVYRVMAEATVQPRGRARRKMRRC